MSAEPAKPLESCPFCGADHGEASLRCPKTDMALPLPGRLLAGKFRFLSELGRGGMGAVWRARNIHVDRDVALKLILPEVQKNQEIVARFQAEARVAARIGHPGICDILDFELTPLGPVIVMELLRGENLAQRIAREGPLPPAVAVRLIRQALLALEAAHRAGVIHRDLKPENLFLHQPDAEALVVKLMDFGISKLVDRSGALTASGVIMGTPEYMAPEQISGAVHADARTDIWAIGAVLYKALTGVDAFRGDNVPAILIGVAAGEPEPIESHVGGVPPELAAVVLRCLAKSPGDRFQSARELAEALAPFDDAAELLSSQRSAVAFLPTVRPGEASPTVVHVPATVLQPAPSRGRPRALRWAAGLGLLAAGGFGVWWWATQGPGAEDPEVAKVVSWLRKEAETATSERVTDPAASAGAESAAEAPESGDKSETAGKSAPTTAATGAAGGEPAPAGDGAKPAEAGDGTKPAGAGEAAPASNQPRLIAAGDYVTPSVAGKAGNQRWAKEYCEALERNKYLGVARWKLANPREAKLFAKVAGIKPSGYWTTANHKGVGLVVWLPKGNDTSVRATKKVARPFCVAPKS